MDQVKFAEGFAIECGIAGVDPNKFIKAALTIPPWLKWTAGIGTGATALGAAGYGGAQYGANRVKDEVQKRFTPPDDVGGKLKFLYNLAVEHPGMAAAIAGLTGAGAGVAGGLLSPDDEEDGMLKRVGKGLGVGAGAAGIAALPWLMGKMDTAKTAEFVNGFNIGCVELGVDPDTFVKAAASAIKDEDAVAAGHVRADVADNVERIIPSFPEQNPTPTPPLNIASNGQDLSKMQWQPNTDTGVLTGAGKPRELFNNPQTTGNRLTLGDQPAIPSTPAPAQDWRSMLGDFARTPQGMAMLAALGIGGGALAGWGLGGEDEEGNRKGVMPGMMLGGLAAGGGLAYANWDKIKPYMPDFGSMFSKAAPTANTTG